MCKLAKYAYNWLILVVVVMKVGTHIQYNTINMWLTLQACKQQQQQQQQIASGNNGLNMPISGLY